jgi:hypothetical protein
VVCIPPCNYVVQKGSRSRPFVIPGDKLKRCWEANSSDGADVSSVREPSGLLGHGEIVPESEYTSRATVPHRRHRRVRSGDRLSPAAKCDPCVPVGCNRPTSTPDLEPRSANDDEAILRRGQRIRRPLRPFSPL